MTEDRKQELRQLLEEAMGSLEIRDEYGGGQLALPVDVYRRYLQERWKYFGLERFSPFWFRPTLDIKSTSIRSRLLDYIREELALFIADNAISIASYFIESTATKRPRVYLFGNQLVPLDFILMRLLDIALVRGIARAVSVFEKCSRPEGAHGFFQDVSVVEGITLKKEIEVFRGVRLVPLLDSGISAEVLRCFSDFPVSAVVHAVVHDFPNFFGQTLLAIDRPGFSIFHKRGPDQKFPQGLPVGDLPFQVGEHDTIFRNLCEVDSFQEGFSQALSLILNFPIRIPRGGFCLEEDRTFNPRHGSIASLIQANRFRNSTAADEDHIEKAKCLYKSLVDLDSGDRKKLQITIDRWVKSKESGREVDKIIDLGISLEALYVPEGGGDTTYKLAIRAARHLGKDKKDREDLLAKFKQIYNCRSKAVHAGHVDTTVKFGEEKISRSKFITHAQDLCLRSITKILDKGKFTNWDSLILGGESEEVSS